jgi:transcriptional regulator with XRE-family HTH domain
MLGELLRLGRQQSRHKTQDALGRAIGLERTSLVRFESGDRVPNADVLSALLDACEVTGLARTAIEKTCQLCRLTEENAPVKVWFSGYLTAEAAAHSVRIWQPLIAPGLVQTPAYARAVFTAMGMSEDQVDAQIAIRLARQSIIARPKPPNVTIVMWEPVLYHQVGTAETMREQLTCLLTLPNSVVVQIVPGESEGNAGLGGAVTLVEGPGGSVLLAEALIEDHVTTDVDLLIKAGATFDAVRGDALPRAQSRNKIAEALKQWNSR